MGSCIENDNNDLIKDAFVADFTVGQRWHTCIKTVTSNQILFVRFSLQIQNLPH